MMQCTRSFSLQSQQWLMNWQSKWLISSRDAAAACKIGQQAVRHFMYVHLGALFSPSGLQTA